MPIIKRIREFRMIIKLTFPAASSPETDCGYPSAADRLAGYFRIHALQHPIKEPGSLASLSSHHMNALSSRFYCRPRIQLVSEFAAADCLSTNDAYSHWTVSQMGPCGVAESCKILVPVRRAHAATRSSYNGAMTLTTHFFSFLATA